MADPKPSPAQQVSVASLFGNPLAVGAAALACLLLTALVPLVTVTGRFLGLGASSGLTATQLAGWAFALPVLAFAAHLATLGVPAAAPYRRIAAMAAAAAWVIVSLVAAVEVINLLDTPRPPSGGSFGGPPGGGPNPFAALAPSVSASPSFGLILHLLAPIALLRANSLAAR